ncbi:MAG: 16S rRNA (guanine(966)-N(2))-methyltransferase RsmD [Anaerovoracaceae bacterium]|jgi:16S rRNA (guanine966-N2)-methyltransferase
MRIVAGDFKGRRLYMPNDELIRPTTEKVKEALFSILAPDIYDANVCDLFAGTGNLGLEALSRGARHCWFCDHAGESIKLIKENVEMCRAEEMSTIIHGDYKKALDSIEREGEKIDIFFLDPPYKKTLLERAMKEIAASGLLAENGLLVAEHHKQKELPDEVEGLRKIKEKKYGRVVLSIYMC